MNVDVIAIGGGFAGLASACRAAERGLKAIVLEQKPEERYACNSRYTSGVFVAMGRHALTNPEEIEQAILASTGALANTELVRSYAHHVGRTVEWIRAQGGRLLEADASEGKQLILAPPRRFREGLDWEGRGGDVLLRTLEAKLMEHGGKLLRGTRAESLLMEDGRCAGVLAQQNGAQVRIQSRAVIIADGGFQANSDMVREHICRTPERLLLRAAPGGDGKGILMAAAVGAATGGYGKFYGHLHHRDALRNNRLWPYPHFDSVAAVSLLVGADGGRFTDEGLGGVCMANAVAALPDPLSASVVFDDAIWKGKPGTARPVGPNPYLIEGGGALVSAPTIAALAQALGLPTQTLADSVARHNAAVTSGVWDALDPPRTNTKFKPMPIEKPPFHGVPLCAGITGTMGGIRINGHAQGLREDGSPIDGLYAVGTPVAGLEGGPKASYVGGLSKAFVLGLIAADHIAL